MLDHAVANERDVKALDITLVDRCFSVNVNCALMWIGKNLTNLARLVLHFKVCSLNSELTIQSRYAHTWQAPPLWEA